MTNLEKNLNREDEDRDYSKISYLMNTQNSNSLEEVKAEIRGIELSNSETIEEAIEALFSV